jgi:phosphate-selective porin OprO/OprP
MKSRLAGPRAGQRAAIALALVSVVTSTAFAQEPPTQSPFQSLPAPPAGSAPAVPPTAVPPTGTEREAQLEERVRQLEAIVNRLSSQMGAPPTAPAAPTVGAPTMEPFAGAGSAAPDVPSPGAPSAMGGAAPGQSLPPNPPVSARFDSPATLDHFKANAVFGPGFEIRSENDEYIWQFHDLTQFDYRGYQQGGQTNVHDTFVFPRQWFMFSGRLTKPFGYFVSFANGFDVFTILDCFLDVDYDPRLRFRIGRYKTPFTYEFFVEPIQGLVVPERSIFFNNFGLNRDEGIMAFGRLFDSKVDYAVGIYNGNRNGFIAQDNSKDVAAFFNYRPFGDEENTLLENFNVGGSVYAGDQSHVPVPQTFRTVVPTTGNAIVGVPFLGLNSNVVNSGGEAFWDLHTAWYYQQWAVLGEWGSGFETYAHSATPRVRTRLPVEAFYVQASYLLTGETRSSLGIVKPRSPFDIRKDRFGTGAIEPYVRYEYMDISNKVFTGGLADPNLWANRLFQTHLGFNWHLTQYLKLVFDWNHAEFNNPVVFAPGRRQLTSDTFWARMQIYF